MVDMLHAHGNHLFYDRKQVQRMKPYPPLRTLLAAALLRQNGVSVALGDVDLESPEQKFGAALDSCPPCFVLVCEEDFSYLTKMCLRRNRKLSFWIVQAARARGIAAAVHRSDSSDHAAEYFRAGFDHVRSAKWKPPCWNSRKPNPSGRVSAWRLAIWTRASRVSTSLALTAPTSGSAFNAATRAASINTPTRLSSAEWPKRLTRTVSTQRARPCSKPARRWKHDDR
jgi:hypothetical protein